MRTLAFRRKTSRWIQSVQDRVEIDRYTVHLHSRHMAYTYTLAIWVTLTLSPHGLLCTLTLSSHGLHLQSRHMGYTYTLAIWITLYTYTLAIWVTLYTYTLVTWITLTLSSHGLHLHSRHMDYTYTLVTWVTPTFSPYGLHCTLTLSSQFVTLKLKLKARTHATVLALM